jgi:3'-phosphoadenosine 5'-phosphosulfate sulfotransferase (PAPS reductase)/FAD synthetase
MNIIELRQMQGLPLELKIIKSQQRIKEWYNAWDGMVYISFSGGIDSTVLLDIVREAYPEVPAVFFNTGTEYPELPKFVKTFSNITSIRPTYTFREIVGKYGYPVVSKEVSERIFSVRSPLASAAYKAKLMSLKRDPIIGGMKRLSLKWRYLIDSDLLISSHCCDVLKKYPAYKYERATSRKPFIGLMAVDSFLRRGAYIKNGCNVFTKKRPASNPMGFWTKQDVLQYIYEKKLPYCSVYGDIVKDDNIFSCTGYQTTGCYPCLFGMHMEKTYPNRLQRLQQTHSKLWNYCMKDYDDGGLGLKKVCELLKLEYECY